MYFFEQVVLSTVMLTSVSIGVFLVYGSIVAAIQKRILQTYFEKLGWRGILLTAWIGTPVHELSHALVAWIFGHKITEIKLFKPDFETMQLGYVMHSYKKWNFFHKLGCFFIGGAPLLVAPLLVLTLIYLFFPELYTALDSLTIDASITDMFFRPLTYAVLFIIGSITLHMSPSEKDIKLMQKGFIHFFLTMTVLSIGLTAMDITYLEAYAHFAVIFHSFFLLYALSLPVLLVHLVIVKVLGR